MANGLQREQPRHCRRHRCTRLTNLVPFIECQTRVKVVIELEPWLAINPLRVLRMSYASIGDPPW